MEKQKVTLFGLIGEWFMLSIALIVYALLLVEWVALDSFTVDYFDFGRFFGLVTLVSAVIVVTRVMLAGKSRRQ